MADFVICPIGPTLHRSGTRNIIAPKVYAYSRDFSVFADVDPGDVLRKAWCIVKVVVWDDEAGAQADSQVTFLPRIPLRQVLTNPQINAANNRLALTDLGVTAVTGDTPRSLLKKIADAMRQTTDFDAERL